MSKLDLLNLVDLFTLLVVSVSTLNQMKTRIKEFFRERVHLGKVHQSETFDTRILKYNLQRKVLL